jgi:uncharacterized protein (TIGR00251 family)
VPTLAVVVSPKSGRDEVAGWRGSELSVRVTAAPDAGKANAAVCKTIAEALGVPKSSVQILRGDAARHKIVEIRGVSDADVHRVFGRPDIPLF